MTTVKLSLIFDIPEQAIEVDGELKRLRATPAALLGYMLLSPGKAISTEDLFEAVWGAGNLAALDNVRSQINYLRRCLGRFGACIETLHGFGYRLRVPADAGFRDWQEAK